MLKAGGGAGGDKEGRKERRKEGRKEGRKGRKKERRKERKKERKKDQCLKLYTFLPSPRFNQAQESELMARKLTALLISAPRKQVTGQRNLSSGVSTRCFFKTCTNRNCVVHT